MLGDIILKGLNEKFKTLKTYDELEEFLEVLTYELDGMYYLSMKKSGYMVGFFYEREDDRVDYMVEDGDSTGNSKISNLYYNIEVRCYDSYNISVNDIRIIKN